MNKLEVLKRLIKIPTIEKNANYAVAKSDILEEVIENIDKDSVPILFEVIDARGDNHTLKERMDEIDYTLGNSIENVENVLNEFEIVSGEKINAVDDKIVDIQTQLDTKMGETLDVYNKQVIITNAEIDEIIANSLK